MITDLQDLGEEGLESLGLFYGSYKAFVEDRDDPDGLGRLKISCPEIYGDDIHDYWALPKSSYAGKDIGFSFTPQKGDGVWVSFEKGDSRFPVWEGGWWIEGTPSKDPDIHSIKTSTGIEISFNDKDGKMEIKSPSQVITLDEANTKTIISQGDGIVTMSPASVEVDFKGKQVVLNSTGASLVAPKVSLGKLDGSQYKAVAGDTLKSVLESILDALSTLTVTCAAPASPSSMPINAAQFLAIKATLNTILSNKVTLD